MPALIIGFGLNDLETIVRDVGTVALMLAIGAAVLWLAERSASCRRRRSVHFSPAC